MHRSKKTDRGKENKAQRQSTPEKKGSPKAPRACYTRVRLEADFPKHLDNPHAFGRRRECAVWSGRRDSCRRNLAEGAAQVVADRILEIGVVQDVAEVGAGRELDPFGQREGLLQVQLGVEVVRSAEAVAGAGVEIGGRRRSALDFSLGPACRSPWCATEMQKRVARPTIRSSTLPAESAW